MVNGDTFFQHLCAGLEDLLHVVLLLVQGPAGLRAGDYSLGLKLWVSSCSEIPDECGAADSAV